MIQKIFVKHTWFLCLVILLSCTSHNNSIVGVKCYKLPATEQQTVDAWKALGINTAYVSEDIARNKLFRQFANQAGIEIYLIFPVFYNPDALKADSTLWAVTDKGEKAKNGWVEFICPSKAHYRKDVKERAKEIVTELKPNGLSIDFIRHFVFWEMVQPSDKASDLSDACYCKNCLKNFAERKGIQYPDSLKSTMHFASYIKEFYLSDWVDTKCILITTMVDELTNEVKEVIPQIKFNLHAVPWRKDDYNGAAKNIAGQNLIQLAPLVDYISPMCYTHMLNRDPQWVDSLVIDFQKQGVEQVLPCIQVGKSYLDQPFTNKEFRASIKNSLKHQSNGIVFWSWEMLLKNEEKQQYVKKIKL